jgi:hypothetical protein
VELAAVSDEDAVVPAISEALGVAAGRGRPALETLVDALAPQDVLINQRRLRCATIVSGRERAERRLFGAASGLAE